MPRSTLIHARPATGDPLLIGEHPALDFLNSVLAPHGETLDYLYDGNAMRAWLSTSQALPEFLIKAAVLISPAQMDQLASDARTLREAFRRVLVQHSKRGAKSLTPEDLKCINIWLARGPLTQALVQDGNGWNLTLRRDLATPAALMAELASVCADLLANHSHKQIRKCENPACTLWFHDTKRGPRRRWCSMAICGNRMKVAAHRARTRGEH